MRYRDILMTRRLHSLDGLRGLAALVVLVHHTMLTFPTFAAPYLSGDTAEGGWAFWLTHSPLHVVWEGRAAVYVFFVLSGLVLTLPLLDRGRAFSWRAYYPQRLLRLYVPVWAAVALGVVWVTVVPRTADMSSLWLQHQSVEAEMPRVLRDMTLLAGAGNLVSPLWSLRWEILFSLLLPAFALIAIKFVHLRWALLSLSVAAIALGGMTNNQHLLFMPMFMLGVVLATSLPELVAFSERSPRWIGLVVTFAVPILLVAPWLARPLGVPVVADLLVGVSAIGALLAVYVAIGVPFVKRFLSTRVMQWVGLVSFSLYLVHEPVLISSAVFFGDDNLLLAAVVGVTVSLILAVAFYRWIEVPSHKLSRTVGALARANVEQSS